MSTILIIKDSKKLSDFEKEILKQILINGSEVSFAAIGQDNDASILVEFNATQQWG